MLAEAVVWRGITGFLQLWIGMAAWYCALPSPKQIHTARRALLGRSRRIPSDAQIAGARPPVVAVSVAAALLPLYVVSWLLNVVDRVGLWLGFNVYLASGVTLLGLSVVAAIGIDLLLV